jgi:Kef-type K+ transport system membrane component KefB
MILRPVSSEESRRRTGIRDHPMDLAEFLKLLVLMLGAAKLFGFLARRAGQPAVLGELIAGVVVGRSVLGLVDPSDEVFRLLADLGVIFLLFAIGLETDLGALLKVGAASTAVAIAGVVAPFGLGYLVCLLLGMGQVVAIVVGAALTATSIGITARVFADLGRLRATESRIIMGAAILDDVLGLVIFTVVSGLVRDGGISALGVAKVTAIAFGFLAVTIPLGRLVLPTAVRLVARVGRPGTSTILALMLAFALGWLADRAGLAPILGAFAAGVLLVGTHAKDEVEEGVTQLGHFFVPLFFVVVGAAVDLRSINPMDAANHRTILVAGLLSVAAVAGKFVSGYAPFWMKANKPLIGVGMMPRGEVGLIFAQMGLTSGILDAGLFTAVTAVMMLTTFLTPPLLKRLSVKEEAHGAAGIEDLVNTA